jgi:F420-dependent methylenetetrahydromethanopterin dehydrogenase
MQRLLLAHLAAACLMLARAPVLNAQGGTYDDNALRVEGQRGDFRIVRGTEGTLVGKIGVFRGVDVTKLVASSEKATIEAKTFVRDYKPGVLLLSLGIATLGASIGVSDILDINRGIPAGLMLVGTGLIVYGAGRLENAYNALSRSIWWYNRDLKL